MYKVSKTVSFSYAHRLPGHKGKCRNLHGHNAAVELTLESRVLNGDKMVADFGDLGGALKSWLDLNFDHKTILCQADPLLKILRQAGQDCFETASNPTAEALAEIIFAEMKKLGLPVTEVRFWETANSMASYGEKL